VQFAGVGSAGIFCGALVIIAYNVPLEQRLTPLTCSTFKEYAYRLRKECPKKWIFWAHAGSSARFRHIGRPIVAFIEKSVRRLFGLMSTTYDKQGNMDETKASENLSLL